MSYPLINECGCYSGQYPCADCPMRNIRLLDYYGRKIDPGAFENLRKPQSRRDTARQLAREYITGEGVSPSQVTPANGEYNEDGQD